MAKPKKEEEEEDDYDDANQRAVFIDTSLNTHIVILVSLTDTFSALKGKLEIEHQKSFPDLGEIKVGALKVKRRGCYYHLMDSLLVKDVFYGVEKNWFLFADASSQVMCFQTPLNVHNAIVPAKASKLSTVDGSAKPLASLMECDEGDRLGLYPSNANIKVPITIVNKCEASGLPNVDEAVGKILDDGSAESKKPKRKKRKRKDLDEENGNIALDDIDDMAVDHARDTKANGSLISVLEERPNNKGGSGVDLKLDVHLSNGEKEPSSTEWPLKKIGDNEDFHSGPALKKCKFVESNHDTSTMSKAAMQKVETILGKEGPQLSELPAEDGREARDNHFENNQGEAELRSQVEGTSINLAKPVNNESLDDQVGAPPQSRAKKTKKAKRTVADGTTERLLPAEVSDGLKGDVFCTAHKSNIFNNQPIDGSPETQAKKTKKAERSVEGGTNDSLLPAKVSDGLKGDVFSTQHESNNIHNQPKDSGSDGQAKKKKKGRRSAVTGTNENLLSDKVSDSLKGGVSSTERVSNIINNQPKESGAVDAGTAVQMNSDAKILLSRDDTLLLGAKERATIEIGAVLKSLDMENSLDSGYAARKGKTKKSRISVSEKQDLSSTNTYQSNGIENLPKTIETTDARKVAPVKNDVKLLFGQDDPLKSVARERETMEDSAASKSVDAKDNMESGYAARKGKTKKNKNSVSENQDLSNTSVRENNVVENQVKIVQTADVGTAVQENNDAVFLLGQRDPLNLGSREGKTIEDSAALKSLHVKDNTESGKTANKRKSKKARNSVSEKQDLSTPIAHENNLFDHQPKNTEIADAGTAAQVNNESKLLSSQVDPAISVTHESETKDTSYLKSLDRKNNMELANTAKKGKTKKAKNSVSELQELSSTNGHQDTPAFATVRDHVKYGSNEAATEFLKTKDGNEIRDLEISKKKKQKSVKNLLAEEHLKDQSHEAAYSKTSEGHHADSRVSGAPSIKVLGNVDKRAHEMKKITLPKKLDDGNLISKRSSHTDTRKVFNASGQRNGLLGTPSAIFDDGSSSSEGDTGVGSDTSTRSPSDIASSSSEGESKGDELTSGSSEKSRKDNKKPNSSDLKNLTLESILKSSSRFKKAKLAASQSQLDSEPVEFVPDSQPYY